MSRAFMIFSPASAITYADLRFSELLFTEAGKTIYVSLLVA